MGRAHIDIANGVGRHLEPESFSIYAEPEIAALPFWVAGECFNPNCCALFEADRPWQKYCCEGCARQDRREHQKWSYKAGVALLVHQMHSYPKTDAERALCNAARRYVRQVQSIWLTSRKTRCALARQARAV